MPYNADLLTALQWAVAAWREVSPSTVRHCWDHTRVVHPPGIKITSEDVEYESEPITEEIKEALSKSFRAARLKSAHTMQYLLS